MSWTKERFDFGSGIRFRLFEIEEKQKELHCHDCLEIDLVEEGDGNYIIGGRIYPVRTGDIFVINNSERHLAIHGEHGLKLSVLIFEADPIWKEKYGKDYVKPFFSRTERFSHRIGQEARDYQSMREAFLLMQREQAGERMGWEMVMEAGAHTLLSLCFRYYNEKQEIGEKEEHQKKHGYLEKVLSYIDAHFAEPMTLEMLAEKAMVSRTYLCRCFRDTTGQTVFAYIEQTRIQYAAYLLKTTEEPIAEIAMESGFESVSYFNRRFRKQYQMTPGHFRRQES